MSLMRSRLSTCLIEVGEQDEDYDENARYLPLPHTSNQNAWIESYKT
jgi:hypothetical protein